MARGIAIVALLTLGSGCFRSGFYSESLAADGSQAADGGVSGVDPLLPFDQPRAVTALNTLDDEEEPSLTADELEIYFERSDEIWFATRPDISSPWSPPELSAELNSSAADEIPTISADGLTIFFSSGRSHPEALGSEDIFMATRAQRSEPWGAPAPLPVLNSDVGDRVGSVSPDLLTLVLMSKRTGVGGFYVATRSSTGAPWSSPVALAQEVPDEGDRSPWLSPDGRALYFDSGRAGGSGSRDIWVATRGDTSAPFSAPHPLASINSANRDERPWLSADMRTIYFSSAGEIVFAAR